MTRVLLCGDESPATLASIRALRAAGHQPFVTLPQRRTYVSRSRDVLATDAMPDPYEHPAEVTVRAIGEVVARRGIEVVLPGTAGSLRALTGREHLLGPEVVVGTTPTPTLDRATDKLTLDTLAADAGLERLPTIPVDADGLDAVAERLPLPGVAKPLHSATESADGRIGLASVHLVDDVEAVRRVVHEHPHTSWLIQRRVSGTLAAIGGVAWQGRLVCAVHQVSPRIWPPERGITAFAVTVEPNLERERAVAAILREIGWSGIFGLQFLLVGDKAYPIDLNPRVYGSIALAIAAGLNLPAIWTNLLVGGQPHPQSYRVGVRYRVETADPRALADAFLAGRRLEAIRGAIPRRGTTHAVFSRRDPRPATMVAAKLFERALPR